MGDGLILMLALATLAVLVGTPVATLVLLVRQRRLLARVAALEMALGLAPQPVAAAPAPPEPAPASETGFLPEPPLPEPGPAPLPPPPPAAPGRLEELARWLRTNWAFTLSAVSLALAGVFFVQYGIEKGLLPPALRVAAAVAFGAALVAAGEWLRRRGGEGEDAPALYLPAVFSAAGIVSAYAGIVAGRLLYGLYGPGLTLAGLVAVTLGAVLLGWRHGPFLVAMGLLGGGAAPFLVAGDSGATAALYPYYLLLAFLGLAVDAFRRWGWVSVLALGIGVGGALAMFLGGAGNAGWVLSLAGLVALAVVVPGRAPLPEHPRPGLTDALMGNGRPDLPVRLAAGMVAVATLALWATGWGLWPFAVLAGLTVALALGSPRAPGIADLALLPAAGFLARLWTDEGQAWEFARQTIAERVPESAPPATASALLAMAAAMTLALALRAGGALLRPLALGAALVAPLAAALLEFRWQPAPVMGSLPWALHVMAVAGLATWLAHRWADLDDRRPMAWAVLAALSLVALALALLLEAAALTLALGVLVAVAAFLDRRLLLVEMGWFLQAGVAAISYRLVIDPGLDWAAAAPILLVLLAFAGAIAAALGARQLLPEARRLERAVAESAAAGWAAVLAHVLLLRRFAAPGTEEAAGSHWLLALEALPWLVLAGAQLWRLGAGGWADRLRRLVAAGAGLLAGWWLALAVTEANPLWGGRILGPPILDTLALAYALPGAMILAGAVLLPGLGRLRRPLAGVGVGLGLLWIALEIRRLWHGPRIDAPFVLEGELYSYTLAMLAAGAALLWQAVRRRSEVLRRAAMLVIGLTVAKVFLWDAAGLAGLVRVLSFACLGLVLAGMAWLNAVVRRAMTPQGSS